MTPTQYIHWQTQFLSLEKQGGGFTHCQLVDFIRILTRVQFPSCCQAYLNAQVLTWSGLYGYSPWLQEFLACLLRI